MTSADLIEFAGGVVTVTGVTVALMKGGFCAREMPIWLRVWLFVAWALLGSRLLTRENQPVPTDEYWVAVVYLHTALVMFLAASWAVAVTIGPGGDRCPSRRHHVPNLRQRRWHVVGGLIALVAVIAVVLWLFW